MASVTELQAELLAALLNSGVSSETVIQAVRALEKQMKPDYGKLEKLVNGNEQEESYNEATESDAANMTLSELETNGQSIADQLLRHDPWHSAKIIKQYMQQHNIPQREAVETTGLNQSHLSQHLNKGTPMKTQKRLTLYKWFEAKQKDVAAQYNNVSSKRQSEHDMSPPNPGSPYKRSRRNRFKWGHASTEILYEAYESQRNPSKEERELLVKACNDAECDQRGIPLEQVNNLGPNLVTESRVYNWFANRRKEEAFKVKLAMDAGTYPVVGAGSIDTTSAVDTKPLLTSPSEKPIMPKPPPLPTFVTHPLTKLTDTSSLGRETSQQTLIPVSSTTTTPQPSTTPLARLPTMSLIKFEPSQPPAAATQSPTVPYGHQSAPALLQRPISVAFGGMPHQILTPAQLQVITGLVPGQMLPISHTATGIVAQPGESGTPGAIPPGHVANLMLPSHLSGQPIPVHALMPMTSGQPQVVYSMPSQSSVSPAMLSTAASTSLVVSNHVPGLTTAGQVVASGSNSGMTIQRQSPLPQIASIQGSSTLQTANFKAPSFSNQILREVVAPVSIPSKISSPSIIRPKQDPLSTSIQSPSAMYTGVPSLRPDNLVGNSKQLEVADTVMNSARVLKSEGDLNPESILKTDDTLNTDDTLVVEMKPVGINENNTVQSADNPNDPSMQISFVPNTPEVTQEIVNDDDFKEPTLTLSEEGVVNRSIGDVPHESLQPKVDFHSVVGINVDDESHKY